MNSVGSQNPKTVQIQFDKADTRGYFSLFKKKSTLLSNQLFLNKITFKVSNAGSYKLIINPEGFNEVQVEFLADTLKSSHVFKIKLKEKETLLDEVVVTSRFNRFSQNGDTIKVDLRDVETRPHADATQIFEVLEGFDATNGSYKALGGNIDYVMIDGKKIFGGNPELTLSNLKADMIDSFEIISKTQLSGQAKKVLNVKLKANKKKGGFGQVGLGGGSNRANEFDFKANRFVESGILANFGNVNNTSVYRPVDIKDDELKYEFYQQGSFFGQTEPLPMSLSETNEELASGLTQHYRLGSNFNKEQKKKYQNLVFYIDGQNQQFDNQSIGSTNIGSETIRSFYASSGLQRSQNINLDYAIKSPVSKRINSFAKVNYRFQRGQNEMKDSTQIDNFEGLGFKRTENQEKQNFETEFGLFFVHKNRKLKTLFSFYSNVGSLQTENSASLANEVFKQNLFSNTHSFEFSHSYPVTKRLLIEHRPVFQVISGNNQTSFGKENLIKSNQNLLKLNNLFYYQRGVYLLKGNVSLLNYSNYKLTNFKSLIISGLSIKFPKNKFLKDFEFNFSNNLILPTLTDILAAADSTNFYFRQLRNQELNPYFKKDFKISYVNFSSGLLNFNTSFNFSETKNEIQSEGSLVGETLFQTTRANINKTLYGVMNTSFVSFKKLPKKTNLNLTYVLDARQTASVFNETNVEGLSLMSNLTVQATYKKSSKLNLKNNFTNQVLKFEATALSQFENRTSLNYELNRKTFVKFTSNVLFGGQVGLQPNLSFEIQRFMLKNNMMSTELKALNVFQQPTNNVISQNVNQQFVNRNLQQPTMILLKLNFYPEKWK